MTPRDIAILEQESWFAGLAVASRAAILSHATVWTAPAATHIYRLGDAPNGLHGVLDGKLRLVSYSATGVEMVAMVLRPGLWFGELSVLDGLERPHDAIADTHARLVHLSMAAIASLASAEPLFWRDIALLGCEHHRMNMRYMARMQTQSAMIRLAGFLLGKAIPAPDAVIRLTQEDLAQIVGVSRQQINILLRRLKARALVRSVYGGVQVCDVAGLRQLVRAHEAGEENA